MKLKKKWWLLISYIPTSGLLEKRSTNMKWFEETNVKKQDTICLNLLHYLGLNAYSGSMRTKFMLNVKFINTQNDHAHCAG